MTSISERVYDFVLPVAPHVPHFVEMKGPHHTTLFLFLFIFISLQNGEHGQSGFVLFTKSSVNPLLSSWSLNDLF